MTIDETKRFTFVSQGMPDDTFSVVTVRYPQRYRGPQDG